MNLLGDPRGYLLGTFQGDSPGDPKRDPRDKFRGSLVGSGRFLERVG